MKVKKYFEIARQVAKSGDAPGVKRHYRLGAVGVRKDGVMVCASNISTRKPSPKAHAERRLVKKMTDKSNMFVVRIDSKNKFKLARPCNSCLSAMRRRGISRCYYTVDEHEYGVIDLDNR
jgi:tRNA(Arg) A34 adenosine deaminase TadA